MLLNWKIFFCDHIRFLTGIRLVFVSLISHLYLVFDFDRQTHKFCLLSNIHTCMCICYLKTNTYTINVISDPLSPWALGLRHQLTWASSSSSSWASRHPRSFCDLPSGLSSSPTSITNMGKFYYVDFRHQSLPILPCILHVIMETHSSLKQN